MKRPELRYAWLEPDAVHPFLGNIDAIKAQHYWIEDYIAEIRFANVPKAIHVQAALGIKDPVDETRWLQGFADKSGYPQGIVAECHLAEPDAGRGARAPYAIRQCPGHPRFRAGRLSQQSRLAGGLQAARPAQSRLLPRYAPGEISADPGADRQSARCRALRRPLRHPRAAHEGIFRGLEPRHPRARPRAEYLDEDLRPRHGRPSLDGREPEALGAGLHRGLHPGPGRLRHQLAGGPHVQLLSRPDRRLCRRSSAGSARRSSAPCSPAMPRSCFGFEGGKA